MKKMISIIIPTYNSKRTIDRCLESIYNQHYNNFEIIIVDNNSSDNSLVNADKYNAKIIQIQCGMSEARNIGISKSHGEYILSIDSDMILPPCLLNSCVNKIMEKNVDTIIIPEISIGFGYFSRCRAFEKKIIEGESGYEGSRFFKKQVIDNIGGYNHDLTAGEDFDVQNRLEMNGYKTAKITDVIIHDEGELSLSKAILKYRLYAKTIDRYRKTDGFQKRHKNSLFKIYYKNKYFIVKNFYLIPGDFILKILGFVIMKK